MSQSPQELAAELRAAAIDSVLDLRHVWGATRLSRAIEAAALFLEHLTPPEPEPDVPDTPRDPR